MRAKRSVVGAVLACGLLLSGAPEQAWSNAPGTHLTQAYDQELQALTAQLKAQHVSAESYVVGLFTSHDVVFLGESQHGLRDSGQFLQRLIPLLYQAGVRTLGYEMAGSADQAAIDRLVNAPKYDAAAAVAIMQGWDFLWTYADYGDVFRAAWTLNHSLPQGAPRFRVLGIDVKPDYRRVPRDMDPESFEARNLMVGGNRDLDRNSHMADIIRREVLAKGAKALVFNGAGHSQTKYRRLARGGERRVSAGYMIAQDIGERATSVLLDGPRPRQADSVIAAVKAALAPNEASVGFNAKDTPLGNLSMKLGPDVVRVADFFDGLVFVALNGSLSAATLDSRYFTENSVADAKRSGALPDRHNYTLQHVEQLARERHADMVASLKK
ncbi:MAG TPA: hypothetical protein VJQ52_21810 [Steroidobacteraceae bacterium]|nr:hypothetical protein [Steroidobacteraceae bacterium]